MALHTHWQIGSIPLDNFRILLTSLGILAMRVIICHYPSRLSLAFEILVWSPHQSRLQTEGFEV